MADWNLYFSFSVIKDNECMVHSVSFRIQSKLLIRLYICSSLSGRYVYIDTSSPVLQCHSKFGISEPEKSYKYFVNIFNIRTGIYELFGGLVLLDVISFAF